MDINIEKLNIELASMSPFQRMEWANDTFGGAFCITSSFGTQAAIMAHIVNVVNKDIPILFLETGYHFSATLAYKQHLEQMLSLNIVDVKPELPRMEFEAKHNYPNENNTDFCCHHNKVLPLQLALENYSCWGTGIRRGQTESRKETEFISEDMAKEGRYKFSPIADYTDEMADLHFNLYELPKHPLERLGYLSIGCDCCTQISTNGDSRSGRWNGEKTECGIHLMGGDGEGI